MFNYTYFMFKWETKQFKMNIAPASENDKNY